MQAKHADCEDSGDLEKAVVDVRIQALLVLMWRHVLFPLGNLLTQWFTYAEAIGICPKTGCESEMLSVPT